MNVENVNSTFGIYVENEQLDIGGGQIVPIDHFVTIFGLASSTPTHTELIAIDSGTKGYTPFFDRCLAEGLLS